MTDNPYRSPGNPHEIPFDAPLYADELLILTFNLSLKDVTAFYSHYYDHSPTLRRQKYLVLGIVCGIPPLIALLVASKTSLQWLAFRVAVLASFLFGTFFYFAQKSAFLKNAQRMVSEGNTRGILGPHQLEMDEKFLVSRSEISETRMLLSGIDRIEETDQHAFFYISAVQAHVVPKYHSERGDPIHFIARARQLVAQAKSSDQKQVMFTKEPFRG